MSNLPLPQEYRLIASVVDNLSSGVLLSDPNQLDNPIVFANPSFTTITGYSSEEVCGRNCRFLQGEATDPAIVREIREAIASRRPFRGLVQNYRKDGSPFLNGLAITPVFDEHRNLRHFLGLTNDVLAPREQLQALAARLTAAREEERTQMAREIHDVLGQALTSLKMDLSWLRRRAGDMPQNELPALLEEKTLAMSQMLDATIGAVRQMATDLRPALLDDPGLEAAAEWHVQQFEIRSGIACDFESQLGQNPLEAAISTALFRILQETLTNVARHARATRVEVKLFYDGDDVVLCVRDNGRGATALELSNGVQSLGIVGMRERMLALNGTIEIHGVAGKGTTVSVRVPIAGNGTPLSVQVADVSSTRNPRGGEVL
jgi:PAS domain S-box-containing protein